ncbi:MAG: hypothetical protein EHM62_00750 [Methylococcus sp.]|nr:MAG: hypothetical protein EHM62_00750 [Methylococcus sp.]
MKRLIILALLSGLAFQAHSTSYGGWGDDQPAEDIDAGVHEGTQADDEIMRNSTGPGEPQNATDSVATGGGVAYDAYGRPYVYSMPYGYGPYAGYGVGYVSGPFGGAVRRW